jgi:hypothetical protein
MNRRLADSRSIDGSTVGSHVSRITWLMSIFISGHHGVMAGRSF